MSTHSSILGWIIPWTEEPGRIHSMRWQSQTHGTHSKNTTKQLEHNKLLIHISPQIHLRIIIFKKVKYSILLHNSIHTKFQKVQSKSISNEKQTSCLDLGAEGGDRLLNNEQTALRMTEILCNFIVALFPHTYLFKYNILYT